MGQVFDEADYRRRLDAAAEISTGEEARLLIKGVFSGDSFGPLNARKTMNEAKQRALIKARRELIHRIRAEDDRMRQNRLIPKDVEEIVTGSSDELVKVP
ncbi:hypothetical protein [Bradyrhizobium sp. SZCCHNR2032]|uniref:hypothetical protein n=1 Tax=Bradyrhizobium sp. SZCCHNR2032 TaxID=3057384 RepID=UPI002916F4E8|nr:hypothetical protein [Bradyrhizobium sp. SZCCHNR2032]